MLSQLVRPSHSSGGPTAGLVAKTQELLQRFGDTPGDSFKERWAVPPPPPPGGMP
jgi:hypothetical protein